MKEENLIFIVSQPRAGSTYLQNLLSNNSQANTCSEPWILLNFVNQLNPKLTKTDYDNKLTADAFKDYLQKHKELDYPKAQKEFILNLYKPMLNGYQFVIDKTPRYWEILEELVVLFPKSKIIILKRNPLDVAKSIIKTWDIKTLEKLAYYKRDLLWAPHRLKNFNDKHKNNPNVYSLRYEDLIADTAVEVKKLYNWCGITYSETVLDTSTNEKYKGKYGDPYQNSEVGYTHSKKTSKAKELSAEFAAFLKGYANYFKDDFLLAYGNYKTEGFKPQKTMAFRRYLHLCDERHTGYNFKKEFKYFLKEYFFRVFK
jgi:hypothetical protein